MTRPKFLELLRALSRHRVAFIVVGGVAAILEGAPVTTLDLDILYSPTKANLERLSAVLRELEATYRDPAGRRILPTEKRLRQNIVNLLQTNLGLLDAMQEIGSGRSYEDLQPRTTVREVGGLQVQVLELAAVIESKEEAAREKDLSMLPVLRRTLELSRERKG